MIIVDGLNVKINMKEFTQRVKLIPFINSQLRESPIRIESDGRVAAFVRKLLEGRKVYPVGNTNGHNYPIGKELIMPPEVRIGNLERNASSVITPIIDLSFEKVIAGGNHIRGNDLEIELSISFERYSSALMELRKAVDVELNFISKLGKLKSDEEKNSDEVSEVLKETLLTPSNTIDISLLDKLLRVVKSKEDVLSKKTLFYV